MNTIHQAGDKVGDRYQIDHPLGTGGSGTLYAARDLHTQQPVAIKAMSFHQLTDWKTLELFEREAKILSQLDHPAIPNYLNYFHIDTAKTRYFYIVQELVQGQSLQEQVATGRRFQERDLKQIAVEILEILHYLHRLLPPVIHRDIKPANIVQRSDGQIYLVDFGAVQEVYHSTFTRGGTFVGTLGYMPPEQLYGHAVAASDLYALGATLLFLATGRSPSELPQVRMKVEFRQQVHLSPAFAAWLDRLLSPRLTDRFASTTAALSALQKESCTTPFPAPKRQQPKGSNVRLRRTDASLRVWLPAKGWLRWGSRIQIDSQSFEIIQFGSTHQIKTSEIEWVKLIKMSGRRDQNLKECAVRSRSSKQWLGIKTHYFAKMLTLPEKVWLVEEVTDFLARVKEG